MEKWTSLKMNGDDDDDDGDDDDDDDDVLFLCSWSTLANKSCSSTMTKSRFRSSSI